MHPGVLAYAFTAGMAATVNPCGLAMLPAYASYYLATEDKGLSGEAHRLARALLMGITVTAGFVVVFTIVGALISLGAYALVATMPWIGLLVGVVLTVLGLWLLSGRRLYVPGLPVTRAPQERSLKAMFLYGVAYGLVSLSCTLPVFLVVVGVAFTQRGPAQGIQQFLAYGLGMGAVLMGISVGLALFREAATAVLHRALPHVQRVSAALLAGAGVYIVYYWLTKGGLLASLRAFIP